MKVKDITNGWSVVTKRTRNLYLFSKESRCEIKSGLSKAINLNKRNKLLFSFRTQKGREKKHNKKIIIMQQNDFLTKKNTSSLASSPREF
jgi:hypothetical protein